MQLFINLFSGEFPGENALLEIAPQGDASIPVRLTDEQADLIARLLVSPEMSAALAAMFLAGVTVWERAVRTARHQMPV